MIERTIEAYLEAMASSDPAPGAGSAAATTGAMGCALGEMVCNITLSSPKLGALDSLHEANQILNECRRRLLVLGPADEAAYVAFREAQAMPRSTSEEKTARTAAMQSSLIVAADVPLEIVEVAVRGLESLIEVATSGSRYTLADIATAAYLVNAAALGAAENVRVNVALIKDAAEQTRLTESLQRLDRVRTDALNIALQRIADRSK